MFIIALSIIAAILIFGFLITAHELGHFIAARMAGIDVNEFAIGMGPAVYKKQGKKTLFSIRALPIGGFCAMEGEDEESDNENAFGKKPVWKRFIVLFAGSFMNFVVGVLIIIIVLMQSPIIVSTRVGGFYEGYDPGIGIEAGDKILKVDGNGIYLYNDIAMFLDRANDTPVDITVDRGGRRIELQDVKLSRLKYEVNGVQYELYPIRFERENKNLFTILKTAWLTSADYLRLVRISLGDLITGAAKVDQMMGPVGVVDSMNTVTQEARTFNEKIGFFLNFAALIAINLAVMNLLPLPALDGGRIIFLVIELIRGKPISPKYEGMVHFVGFALIMALAVYVFYNDIARIVTRIAGG